MVLILATLLSLYEPIQLPSEGQIEAWRTMSHATIDDVIVREIRSDSFFRSNGEVWQMSKGQTHNITNLAFCIPGKTTYDEMIRLYVATTRVTAASYAALCYGQLGVRQMVRAVYERAYAYREPPEQLATMANGCAHVMPCHPDNMVLSFYRVTSRLYPRLGMADTIPVAGKMFSGYSDNTIDLLLSAMSRVLPRHRILPSSILRCKSYDENEQSYALPLVGIAIHRPDAYAHEFAHFFNPPAVRSPENWQEFLPAFHALKLHAFLLGIDLGAPGGWADYWAIVGNADAIARLWRQGVMSRDGVKLLEDVLMNKPHMRGWCANDAIGRMVL